MKRHLCATALFALALIPDWASACWPRGAAPAPEPVYFAPAYRALVSRGPIYYPAQPVFVAPIPPAMVVAPPRVEPVRPRPGGTLIGPAQPIAQPNPAPKPPNDPVRPASGVEVPPAARPEPAPAPAPSEPKRGGLIEIPKPAPEPKLPPVESPKAPGPKVPPVEPPKTEGTNLPPLGVPTAPGVAPKLPPIELPKVSAPKLPSLDPGSAPAIPSAAPAPDALPPLTLPPDSPVAPEKPNKPNKPVEVKSSPLTGAAGELKVSVFPATGAAVAGGLRKVGFYNHTARDLSLTIEGKPVTLPAMSYIYAQLPPAFTWKCADKPATKETVPAGAVGVDVLIRE